MPHIFLANSAVIQHFIFIELAKDEASCIAQVFADLIVQARTVEMSPVKQARITLFHYDFLQKALIDLTTKDTLLAEEPRHLRLPQIFFT